MLDFKKILTWLQGKKTYFVIIAASVFNTGIELNFWTVDNSIWQLINFIFILLGLGAFRSAIKNISVK